MRTLGALILSAFVASCMRLEPPAAAQMMCVVDVQMPSDADRQRVLAANPAAFVDSVRRGETLITPLETGLLIATKYNECTAFHGFALREEAFNIRERVVSSDQANAEFAQQVSLPRSHTATRQCVVRFSEHDEWQFARLNFLWLVGLRGVQIEAADGQVFITADEPCDLLRAIVDEAHEQDTGGAPRDLLECPQASLAACGYPGEIQPI